MPSSERPLRDTPVSSQSTETQSLPEHPTIEIGPLKLHPRYTMFVFSCALSWFAMPALLLFIADQPFFLSIDISKLLLLCFASAAPVFGCFYAFLWIEDDMEKIKTDVIKSISAASILSAVIYIIILVLFLGQPVFKLDAKTAVAAPIVFALLIFAAQFVGVLYKNKKRQKQKIISDSIMSDATTKDQKNSASNL